MMSEMSNNCSSPAPSKEIPLASSYPVMNEMTPRMRRREAMKERMAQKKADNERRAKQVAANRAAMGLGENDPRAGNVEPRMHGRKPKRGDETKSRGRSVDSARSKRSTASAANNRKFYNMRQEQKKKKQEKQREEEQKKQEDQEDALRKINEEVTKLLEESQQEKVQLEESFKTLEAQNVELVETKTVLDEKVVALQSEVEETSAELTECKQKIAEAQEREGKLSSELERQQQLEMELRRTNAGLEDDLKNALAQIEQMKLEIIQHEKVARDLRNTILELKGNIRVFARVRPMLTNEGSEEEVASNTSMKVFEFPLDDPERQHITLIGEAKKAVDGSFREPQQYPFKFDKVFHQHDGQAEVFEEVSHLVQSSLDGYRVCIFAYGQTGSGKTYTMEGDAQNAGIIPRSVNHLFTVMQEKQNKQGWVYELKVSFLEIYNETIRDLSNMENKANFEIRHTKDGDTVINGLTEAVVSSPEDIHKLMTAANSARSVANTKCNERSSRSHSVFILTLIGTHAASGEKIRGTLNLVDLAGSERLNASQAKGQQLKETQAINKSLACLGDVIFSLASGSKHVPFRNSKLTYLLQNSLGGNSKTLMMINLSPLNAQESLCSLRFGHKVNSCEIGTAKSVKVSK